MKCKRHTVDFTSNIGVCASCLRERLLYLAASAAIEDNNNRKISNPPPQVLIFPSSVGYSCKDLKSKEGKFSKFPNLFKPKSQNFNSDVSESSSRSWISSILSTGGRKNKQATSCGIEDVITGRKPRRIYCRGMSPDPEPLEEVIEESPGRLRSTPMMRKTKIGKGIGKKMGFCLSPLVRASPNCPFKRKMRFSSEYGNSGEVLKSEKPHMAEAASFCGNRSKKLVDLGRVDRRR